jgi:hypothetical protein
MPLSYSSLNVNPPTNVIVLAKSVTTTVSIVVAANPDRKGLTLYNLGNAAVYIGYTNALTSSVGVSIVIAKGGIYEFPDPVEVVDIYAITSSGTATLEVTEKS